MRHILYFLFAVIAMAACKHRPLEEFNHMKYVKVYFDENIRNVNFGLYDDTKPNTEYQSPKAVRVTLADKKSGKVLYSRHLTHHGCDERGNYVDGYVMVKPGSYHLLAYNYDTKSDHVLNENSYYDMEVYTNSLDENTRNRYLAMLQSSRGFNPDELRYEPEHFFVASQQDVTVRATSENDTLSTALAKHFTAESVVKTYYMQVNVKGVEHVRTATALITGMSGAIKLHNRQMVENKPASVFFGLQNGENKAKTNDGVRVGYAYFNTFGKLPNVEGYIEIAFEFKTHYNTVQTEVIRVTDMFDTEQVKDKQWIIIDKVIEITPPDGGSGGGLSPGVNLWEQIESGFTI